MDKENKEVNEMKYIGWGIVAIILIVIIFGSFYTISAGTRGVLVTLGNPNDAIITEGLHFKAPFIQSIIKMDIKTQKDEVEATSASKDLQTVNAKIAVNYHLESSSAPRIYQEVGIDYVNRILSPAIQESTKASTAQYTAEELITKREQVRETIKSLLIEKMGKRGIVIEDVLITNFDFSESFNQAIEAKVTAEQNALKEFNQLKAVEYQAQQRVSQATGEAEAIKIQAQAIQSQGGKDYVQLQAIAKWNGILPQVTSSAIPFININTNTNNTN
jgi:regulator of protease activity HflC (stomatin/prohibitin superfamily)